MLSTGKYIFLLFVLFLLCQCSEKFSAKPTIQRFDQTIIVVPGFKGSNLEDAENKTRWLTANEVFFGDSSLALPNQEIGISNAQLKSTSILKEIRFIPGIYSYDVYGKFLDQLHRRLPSAKIVEFYYDWRKDNIESVKLLSSLIQKEKALGTSSISLVGHSLGAALVAYYLRYGDADLETANSNWYGLKNIEHAVLAGGPFRGSLDILHDMQFGSTTVLNSSLLSAEAVSSFPSSYQLLPALPSAINSTIPIDIFSISSWNKANWGLLKRSDLTSSQKEARLKFIENELRRARRFYELLNTPEISPGHLQRCKIIYFLGVGRQTRSSVAWRNAHFDFDDQTFSDGDGVVTMESATLPKPYKVSECLELQSSAAHEDLLFDAKNIETIVKFLAKNNFH